MTTTCKSAIDHLTDNRVEIGYLLWIVTLLFLGRTRDKNVSMGSTRWFSWNWLFSWIKRSILGFHYELKYQEDIIIKNNRRIWPLRENLTSSFNRLMKFSWKIPCSSRRILRSLMLNEHPVNIQGMLAELLLFLEGNFPNMHITWTQGHIDASLHKADISSDISSLKMYL